MSKIIGWVKSHIRMCVAIAAAVVVLVVGISVLANWNANEKIDTSYILATLQKSSELTTAKLTFTGFSEFKDEGVSFWNRSDFKMVYTATARAGIDVSAIGVTDNPATKTLHITIPKATVLDVKVDMENIRYFDEKFSLFNVDAKDDANAAIALVEKEAEKEVANMGILAMADEQAHTLIVGLLRDVVPSNYTIEILQA